MSEVGLVLALELRAATGGTVVLRAAGRSMRPCIEEGDLVEVEFGAGPPSFGGIALFRLGSTLQVHRVVGWRGRGPGLRLLTKGDACPLFDPPLAPEQVLGTVVRVRKRGVGQVVECAASAPPNRCIAAVSWAVGRGLGLTWRLEPVLSPSGRARLHTLRWWLCGLVRRAVVAPLVRLAMRGAHEG